MANNDGRSLRDGLSCSAPSPAVSAVPASIPNADDDPYWDYDDHECWNCGGEGFVTGCSWDWQCDTYDPGEETCLCTRPCHICRPPKPNPDLAKILGNALAQAGEAGTDETGTGSVHEHAVGNADAPDPSSSTPVQKERDNG